MGAFDKVTKKIHDSSWDKDEEVVITELLYGDSVILQSAAMAELSMSEMQDEEKRNALKMGELELDLPVIGLLEKCIVSWTLKNNGKVVPVTPENIKKLPAHYGDYIAEQIEELNPTRDKEFPNTSGTSGKEGKQLAAGNGDGKSV